jgi:Double zinc ribbon
MAFCGKCGTEVRSGSNFCSSCGAPAVAQAPMVAQSAPVAAPPSPPPPPISPAVAPLPIAGGFCSTCGKPVGAADGFCKSCGSTLGAIGSAGAAPPTAAQAVAPVAAVPVVAQAAQVPPRKSHAGAWIVLILALVIGIVAFAAVIENSGPKPEEAVDGARTAYLQHDQASFDKFVNVNAVLSDGTDQMVNNWLAQNKAGGLVTAGAGLLTEYVKTNYLPAFAQSVDQWVVSGTWPDQSQSSDNNSANSMAANFVSSMLRTVASSQLTYQGVVSKSVNDSTADLSLDMGTSMSSQPVVVKLRLQKDGDHWQIVAIEDLAGLMDQLNAASKP